MTGRLDLPLLEGVLDRGRVEEVLRPLLAVHGDGPEVPKLDSAVLVVAHPGRRALVAYGFSNGRRLFGKHFSDPSQARRVHAAMVFLSSRTFRGSRRYDVPRPLGYVPELSLVIYAPVAGRCLGDLLQGDAALAALRRTAGWLAQLHRSRLPLDRRLDVSNELANSQLWADLIEANFPEDAPGATAIVRRLRKLGQQLELELDVPIHKDLHHGHVIVGERLSVVDFDEMRYGDRTFDLAHFCAYLRLETLRRKTSHEPLERAFLDEYERRTGWERDDRFEFFFAYTCLKIARQLCQQRGIAPHPRGEESRRQLRATLREAHTLEAVHG